MIFAGLHHTYGFSKDHNLSAHFARRLQENRVHFNGRLYPAYLRLKCLRASNLAARGSHEGIIGHVLRFERSDTKAFLPEIAAQGGHDDAFSDVRRGPLDHDLARSHASSAGWVSDGFHVDS